MSLTHKTWSFFIPAEAKHIDVATAAATIFNEHGVAIERCSDSVHGRGFGGWPARKRGKVKARQHIE